MKKLMVLVVALVISLPLVAAEKEAVGKTEAVKLFDGKSLEGWDFFLVKPELKMADVWSVSEGNIVCKGKPMGYLATKKDYTNFSLIVEYRWAPGKKATNSGVLMRITGKPQGLPKCMEVQLQHGKAGDIYGFHGFKVASKNGKTFNVDNKFVGKMSGSAKAKDAEKKPGEWNKLEITVNKGDVTVILNGEKVNEAKDCEIVAGKVALQSEGGEIHFKTVEITPIK